MYQLKHLNKRIIGLYCILSRTLNSFNLFFILYCSPVYQIRPIEGNQTVERLTTDFAPEETTTNEQTNLTWIEGHAVDK